jgi:error-prone DNA polymerase
VSPADVFVPLWCKTNYSFLEGASHPDEMVSACVELGHPCIGITDRDGVYGIVRAHVAAKPLGVRTIPGAEMSVAGGATVVLLPRDRGGYTNLCKLITKGRLRNEKGFCEVSWREVAEHSGGNCALLASGVEHCSDETFGLLKDGFADDLSIVLSRHLEPGDVPAGTFRTAQSERHGVRLVAATEVLYHERRRKRLQDVLTCIRSTVPLTEAGRLLYPNQEHELKSQEEFCRLFADVPAAIDRTVEIALACTFSLDELTYRYPSELLPDGYSTATWLRELTFSGARERYGGVVPARVREQIEKELALVEELDYCGYFLTMWDIVQFCKKNDILCQGRGSAANSAVCFCLGITAVDPVQMDLLFERFISRERAEPPDIDLDIEHRRREEVIQHMYKKYGRDRAAMVANVVRYRRKSAIREVGKVLGIPPTSLDMLSKLTAYRGGTVEEAIGNTGLSTESHKLDLLTELIGEIRDFPRHLSIHPGGFLLGSAPVCELVPIENATMPERTVIQWDKYDVEELGLFKVDLLGLGALTHLHFSFDLLEEELDLPMSMATIPRDDPATYDMLCKADTVGVFQIESRAQMSMLPRLKPRTFYDIVIEISIVRPGPIAGGMVHPFLKRRNGEEVVSYPHPSLERVLKKTMGVPLFQEQVMKLAVVAAGYTPGEADQLRRDMAAWRRQGSIEKHKEKLINGMLAKKIRREFAEQVFEQIKGFGEYGFPESHAASFAHIAYCTAWMKCHYPVIFTCGILNAWPMGFYSPATIVQDAKRHRIRFLPVDILSSRWYCTLESDDVRAASGDTIDMKYAIRMGLRFVRRVGETDYEEIAEARERGLDSLVAFLEHAGLSSDTMESLAQAGAFSSLGGNRRSALWEVIGKGASAAAKPSTMEPTEDRLFSIEEQLPEFSDLNDIEQVLWDHAYAGHSTNGHPLEPYRTKMKDLGLPDAQTVNRGKDGKQVSYAGLVICRQVPETANGVLFITLEDETGFVNCIVWQKVFQQYRTVILANTFLGVSGKIQADKGVLYVIPDKAWKPELNVRRASHQSHDFR